jgi:hypothetical protein
MYEEYWYWIKATSTTSYKHISSSYSPFILFLHNRILLNPKIEGLIVYNLQKLWRALMYTNYKSA